jgi:arylsulfatase A-like enzyme
MVGRLARREFLELAMGGLAAVLPGCGRGEVSDSSHPDVLFIAVDDLNAWLGCLGHPVAKTPHMDRLAASGTLFTRAYCASPLCKPSRTSVLTGLHPATHGVYSNQQRWRRALEHGVTLPECFMQHGYEAVGGGKLFHGSAGHSALQRVPWCVASLFLEEGLGTWSEFYPRRHDPPPERRGVQGRGNLDWGPLDVEDEEMGDVKLARWAAAKLQAPSSAPLFLAVGFSFPHPAWFVPRRYFELYDAASLPLPPVLQEDLEDVPPEARRLVEGNSVGDWLRDEAKQRSAIHAYLASVSFVDSCVGLLLEGLEASPRASRTIVVLWSDHGFHLGEKLHWRKSTLWEESTRVPLIVQAPRLGRPGAPCGRPVSLVDVYPTLLDLCGLSPCGDLEGVSLAPLLADPEMPWARPALTTYLPRNDSVRSERWRYTRYADGSEELYDHELDPFEWTNRASDPELTYVKEDLARWFPSTQAPLETS